MVSIRSARASEETELAGCCKKRLKERLASLCFTDVGGPMLIDSSTRAGCVEPRTCNQLVLRKGASSRAEGRATGRRWMLGIAAVPALLQIGGLSFLPESPR